MRHAQNRRHRLAAAATVVAFLGASCGGDGDGDALGSDISADRSTTTPVPETTTTTAAPETTTTTTAAPTPEEEVLAAYLSYWKAVDEAFSPPQVRPDFPALSQFATGEALEGITENANDTLGAGEVFRILEDGQYAHQARVLSVEDRTASVRDCSIDDTVRLDASTGETLDDSVATKLYIGMLVREGDEWKLADLHRQMTWEGVAGCALELE